jgi:hypothetical protein
MMTCGLSFYVLAGLGPAIHAFLRQNSRTVKTWMPGTSPGKAI